jgi:hypothetical protein
MPWILICQVYSRSSRPRHPPLLDPPQCRHQRIHLTACIVECQRGPDRSLHAKPSEDRLCAVVARPHRNSFPAQRSTDIRSTKTVENERNNTCLLTRGADQSETGDFPQPGSRVFQQLMLVPPDDRQTDARNVIDRRCQPHRICNIAGARLELRRRLLCGWSVALGLQVVAVIRRVGRGDPVRSKMQR